VPVATTDAQRALTESIRDWAERAHPIDAVRAATPAVVVTMPPRHPQHEANPAYPVRLY
jgi:hypothetical protein